MHNLLQTYIFVAKHNSLWGVSCPGLYNMYGEEVYKSDGQDERWSEG